MPALVLTVIGDDRVGLVEALADTVSTHGGNWEHSQMAELAGKFAGIVVVSVPSDRLDALVAELTALESQGLQVIVERTDEPEPLVSERLHLDLLGADRPGIVAEISAALADAHVSIEELSTDVRDAPMAGGTLFEARAVLSAPVDSDTDALRAVLEALADELMVEIQLSD